MTTAIVFICQQQNCMYANIWAIFFISFIVSEKIIVEKIGWVTIFIYFLRLTFFYWSIFSKLVSTITDGNEVYIFFISFSDWNHKTFP